jgi:hypothetical protein
MQTSIFNDEDKLLKSQLNVSESQDGRQYTAATEGYIF